MINREQRLIPYKRRINEVYPDLPIRTLASIEGNGQNNDIVVVDNAVVFRFPRYPEDIERLERTTRILHTVKPFVSLPVPDPIYSSFEPGDVGSVFVGYPLISGEPLWHATLDGIVDEATLQSLADQAATFLRQLHRVPVERVIPEASSTFQPLEPWDDLFARIRQKLFSHMRPDARRAVARHFEAFLEDPAHRTIETDLPATTGRESSDGPTMRYDLSIRGSG